MYASTFSVAATTAAVVVFPAVAADVCASELAFSKAISNLATKDMKKKNILC